MLISESTKRKPKKRRPEPVVVKPALSPDDRVSLRAFVRFALGSGHLTWWEEKFLSDRHQELYHQTVWLTDKQWAIIRQLKGKLHYDQPDVPLPPIDPDGVEENDDPDGLPVARGVADQFADDEFPIPW